MNVRTLAACVTLLLSSLALAVPVAYNFTTSGPSGNSAFNPNGSPPTNPGTAGSIQSILAGTDISGSFIYDSQAIQTGMTGGGGAGTRGKVYGGHLLADGTPYSSFTGLSGSVNGATPRSFTDPRGFTIVVNDNFQGVCSPTPCTPPPMVDDFEFFAENTTGTSFRNLTGFNVAVGSQEYRLFNVRMFWLEGQMVPNLVPDLYDNPDQLLPSTPPSVNGRLALHFVPSSNLDGMTTQYIVFYDNLLVIAAVPEPETYALLLAGLGLLGFGARRRIRGQ